MSSTGAAAKFRDGENALNMGQLCKAFARNEKPPRYFTDNNR